MSPLEPPNPDVPTSGPNAEHTPPSPPADPPLSPNPFAAPGSSSELVPDDPGQEHELAGRIPRLLAQVLDNIISGSIALIALIPLGLIGVLGSVGDVDDALVGLGGMAGVGVLTLVLLIFGGIQAYLLSTRGQTLGKMVLKVRIVKVNGEKAGFVSAVVLRLFVTGLLLGGAGVVFTLAFGDTSGIAGNLASLADAVLIFRPDRRCLHDFIAGTKVVRA